MIELSLRDIATATAGRLVGRDVPCKGISSDTRSLKPGALFVALKGENFDAHEMLEVAQSAGASAVLVARECATTLPQVIVSETRRALGTLARHWRRRFAIPVVAITGSHGKTTTKELVASILRQVGPTLATTGNLNNDIGVPLTLFGLDASHRHAVIEMGANAPDDITGLVAIAEPTLALVTMCGPAHLAGFGSLAGVAQAKGQIYSQLDSAGTAVINLDDPFHLQWQQTAGAARCIGFGFAPEARVTARDIEPVGLGEGTHFTLSLDGDLQSVHLPLDGEHNVRNALAAAAVGHALGIAPGHIRLGLETAPVVKGRLNIRRTAHGLTVIDDTYNAAPASLKAALDLLARQAARRWLVLGDMGELGPEAPRLHFEAGLAARAAGVERLLSIGPLSTEAARAFGEGARSFDSREAALAALRESDHEGVTLLVKGSRSMQLDLLVRDLMIAETLDAC